LWDDGVTVSARRQRGRLGLRAGVFVCCWIVVAAGVAGCGGKRKDAALSAQDYKRWRNVCESLITQKQNGFRISAVTFSGLAEELSESKNVLSGPCEANRITVDRFLDVCRAIGIAYSVLAAEAVDQESARCDPTEMMEDCCDEPHGGALDAPPPGGYGPRPSPPAIIREDAGEPLAKNVAFVELMKFDVDGVSARMFGGPGHAQ